MEAGVTTTTTTTTTARSVLDKPLHELTEDDISQLTREDYRRYLKEKGMRRPSWNKSQAIQQVISLKSLLEPSPPTATATATANAAPPPPNSTSFARPPPQEIPTPPHVNSGSTGSAKELSPADVDDGGPSFTAPLDSDPQREAGSGHHPGVDYNSEFRSTDSTNSQVGQMTIFYSGKVNVYDGVPAEKARAIMQLAASPIQFLQDEPIIGNSAQWPVTNHFPTSSVRVDVIPPSVAVSQSMQSGKARDYAPLCRQEGNAHEPDVEGQTNRQVSLLRYFEKRKDRKFNARGRLKNKKKTGSSSGLEMYLNNQMRIQVFNGQPSLSGGISSPTQPGQPQNVCGSVESQLKNAGRPLDLNDKV